MIKHAFPLAYTYKDRYGATLTEFREGMTERLYIASKIMASFLTTKSPENVGYLEVTKHAAEFSILAADALLRADRDNPQVDIEHIKIKDWLKLVEASNKVTLSSGVISILNSNFEYRAEINEKSFRACQGAGKHKWIEVQRTFIWGF